MRCPGQKILILAGLMFISSPFSGFSKNDALTVTRCIDGDTLKLSNGEKVRLIGVDTPESKDNAKLRRDSRRTGQGAKEIIEMGKAAAEFTRRIVDGKQVRLDYDVQRRDKYGRLLAYVYILVCNNCDVLRTPEYEYLDMTDPDGRNAVCIFLNATLLKAGYAQVMTVPPNVKYQESFVSLEKDARGRKWGLWK
ncbi:MAG: thermonuclease family protein [Candidatus Omnitrophota bacterium]